MRPGSRPTIKNNLIIEEHRWRPKFTLRVKVSDVKQRNLVEITAMIDSGVTVSAIHSWVVQQHGWQVFDVPKSMQGPVLNADDTENKHGIV